MGVVFEVEDRVRSSRVALKTLHRLNPTDLYRFKKEFRSLQALAHPNLITLYEFISEQGQWFFTMELVEGKDFLTHVASGDRPARSDSDTEQMFGNESTVQGYSSTHLAEEWSLGPGSVVTAFEGDRSAGADPSRFRTASRYGSRECRRSDRDRS